MNNDEIGELQDICGWLGDITGEHQKTAEEAIRRIVALLPFECVDCRDTGIISEIVGEGSSEGTVEGACPKCSPDMKAHGDKWSDWH